MAFNRRSLITRAALLVASGFLAPSFITRTAMALDGPSSALGAVTLDPTKKNRILVVLQLSGGNDGINTLIPFVDPTYATLRPTLGVATSDVLRLTDSVGLNPNLGKLKTLYDQGKMAVVQGVGYPNPNRSHFRSMDIWHSAHPESFERVGWLRRAAEGGGNLPDASQVPRQQWPGEPTEDGRPGHRRQPRHAAVLGEHGRLRHPRQSEGQPGQAARPVGRRGRRVHAGSGEHEAPGRPDDHDIFGVWAP